MESANESVSTPKGKPSSTGFGACSDNEPHLRIQGVRAANVADEFRGDHDGQDHFGVVGVSQRVVHHLNLKEFAGGPIATVLDRRGQVGALLDAVHQHHEGALVEDRGA